MNSREMGSTLGICLAFIAVLSMIVMPGFVAAQERATATHSVSWRCPCGRSSITIYVEIYDDGSGNYSGNAWYVISGCTVVDSWDIVISATIVYAGAVVHCSYCGGGARITVWVCPPTSPYKYGESITPF
jgi:hypothetical protein